MVRRLLSSLAILLVGLVMPPVAAYAAWPQTPPNDPGFAPCENAATFTPNCYSDPGADQWDMFGPLSDAQYPCPFPIDRKSTRLNSSHLVISYAVFCLKKKNK